MKIRSQSLKEQVRNVLITWLSEGRLAPGERLQEIRLTERLGVSRTPLREALHGLEQEGLVISVPNRGFRIPELDERVVREIYPIIGRLESLALHLGGIPGNSRIVELRELNSAMAAEGLTTRQRFDLDRRWHDLLVAHNPNQELARTLAGLRRRVMFYDGAWQRGLAAIEKSCAAHAAIVDWLASGRLGDAVAAVERHYLEGISVVVNWLENKRGTA